MEVYTNPPEGTYMTGTAFTLLHDGQAYKAWAVKKSQLFPILAVYTIIIQFVFVFAWWLITGAIVGLLPNPHESHETRIRLVGLILLWNSADPFSAVFVLGLYVKKLLWMRRGVGGRGGRNGVVSSGDVAWAVAFLLSALFTAGISLSISVNYGAWLELSKAAPVQPSRVVLPIWNGMDKSFADAVKFATLLRPASMRAMGSSEATSDISVRESYRVSKLSEDGELEYGYEVSAEAFGLQSNNDLVHKVQGRCTLRYDWIHPSSVFSKFGDSALEYHAWDNADIPVTVAGGNYPFVEKLHLLPIQETRSGQTALTGNSSFALVIGSACVASMSPSTDPWYETEPISELPDEIGGQYTQLKANYRIKPSRPVLACEQETQYCVTEGCYSLAEVSERGLLPNGTTNILVWHFAIPKIFHLALYSGAFALQSFAGADALGMIIDAEHSTLDQDIERLVLSAYLASKEAFRDSALMQLEIGWSNVILDERGKVLEGGADFVLRTDSVVALRVGLLALAPVLLVAPLIVYICGKAFRKDRQNRFKIRQGALSAVHLFRILDEKHTDMDVWEGKGSSVPLPSVPLPDRPFIPARGDHEGRYGIGPGAPKLKPTLWYTSDRWWQPAAAATGPLQVPVAQPRPSSEQGVLLAAGSTPGSGSGSEIELDQLQAQHDSGATARGTANIVPTSPAFYTPIGSTIPRRSVPSITLSPYQGV